MKKEAMRCIKIGIAGIAVLAAVICYNMEWNRPAGTSEFQCVSVAETERQTDRADEGLEHDENGTSDTEPSRIWIHVCGAVTAPGVYELYEGSRIYQAVEMAGGFTEDAAKDFLNMAGLLEDGMKIQIPNREEAEAWSGREAVSYGEEAGKSKVNLNTAVKEELMTLAGIGESRAEAIIAYRQEYGPFKKIEDIMEVSGIKEAAFQKIKDDITV